MTDALAAWQAAYAEQRQLYYRQVFEEYVWARHEHQWQMYWVYAGSNWRSMNECASVQVWPEVREKPKAKGVH